MTFCHSNFEDVIPLKDINLLAVVVCYLSLHICAYFYWLHVENMAASDWLKCKVTPHWLPQKNMAASDWLKFKVTPHWLIQ